MSGLQYRPEHGRSWSYPVPRLSTLLSTVPAGKYGGTVRLNAPTLKGHEGDLLALFSEVMLGLNDRSCPD
ncbi:hypothetical protein [Lentzea sp. NPDC051838]|uniref:hypothetical protein n=1 Tax=Lentzea sp. NPDC051838 TaxID=3154849 RepID=UPI00343E7FA3